MSALELLVAVAATTARGGCVFTAPSETGTGCTAVDLTGLPAGPFILNDSWPEPYLIGSPCGPVDITACPACKEVASAATASAIQLLGPKDGRGGAWGCHGPRCLACDSASGKPVSTEITPQGITLRYGGGDAGRETVFNMICDPDAPADNGPEPQVAIGEGPYSVTWKSLNACGKKLPVSQCHFPPLALPTKDQLKWQGFEIGALIHFNMMTYGSCGDPSTFNPVKLSTDQWAESFVALGVKEAVLVAKHGCGFVTWPSNATVPGGGRYNYSVVSSAWQGGKGDVLSQFLESCNKNGIGSGFYYSLGGSSYANKMKWSAAEIIEVEKQHLVELWDTYGNHAQGGHKEIWFDGGFEGPIQPFVEAKLKELQPQAVAFNGCVQKGSGNNRSLCVTPNSVRWIGTEAGTAPDPNWSTGYENGGDPDADIFQPAECDTTLQNGDAWFYNPTIGIRSLATLLDVYHGTVGRNGFLMLDFAPNQQGLIAPDQVVRYAEFGTWIKTCYGSPLGSAAIVGPGPNASIAFAAATAVDRVVLREDQTTGQRIRGYFVEAQLVSGGAWTTVASGASVGNKAIDLFSSGPATVSTLRVRVTAAAHGQLSAVRLVSFDAFKCNRPSDKGCTLQSDQKVSYTAKETIATIPGANATACCTECSRRGTCAVFLVSPATDCVLLNADGVSMSANGWTTGSPN